MLMDDFLIYGGTFKLCLKTSTEVLRRCEEVNLALNYENCHFLVPEGVVLGLVVSHMAIEVDISKIEIITTLSKISLKSPSLHHSF